MAGSKRPGVAGKSGGGSAIQDGTLGRFFGSVPGVVSEWRQKAARFSDDAGEAVQDWTWRKAGLGYDLASGNVAKVQKQVDHLTTKARKNQTITQAEKDFLEDLYEWIATGGQWKWLASSPKDYDRGLWEAGQLLKHYLHGGGRELRIEATIYETSVIVKYAMSEIKTAITQDLKAGGSIRNGGSLRTTELLKAKNFGDSRLYGQVLDGGVLLAEQGNARLKYANNRFVLKSRSTASGRAADGSFPVQTIWRVDDRWDYNSFGEQRKLKRNDVTELPLKGGAVLRLPDGLSHHLTVIGLAQEFAFYSEWKEDWTAGKPGA